MLQFETTNIYKYNFNQNMTNFIKKNILNNLHALVQE